MFTVFGYSSVPLKNKNCSSVVPSSISCDDHISPTVSDYQIVESIKVPLTEEEIWHTLKDSSVPFRIDTKAINEENNVNVIENSK